MVYLGYVFAPDHSRRSLARAGPVARTKTVAASAAELSHHYRILSRRAPAECAFERETVGRKHERPDARLHEFQTVPERRLSVELLDLLADRRRLAGMGLQSRITG